MCKEIRRIIVIHSRKEMKAYLQQDAIACRRKSIRPHMMGDYEWKFQYLLRVREYETNCLNGWKKLVLFPLIVYHKWRFGRLRLLCNFTIPLNVFDAGLSIAHIGTIVVNASSVVGKNCRIQTGVTLGATNGSKEAPILGDNVFLGDGCKLIGGIHIANDVCIGANAVVAKDIVEAGTTWAGVPARKISNHNSHSNLAPALFAQSSEYMVQA